MVIQAGTTIREIKLKVITICSQSFQRIILDCLASEMNGIRTKNEIEESIRTRALTLSLNSKYLAKKINLLMI